MKRENCEAGVRVRIKGDVLYYGGMRGTVEFCFGHNALVRIGEICRSAYFEYSELKKDRDEA